MFECPNLRQTTSSTYAPPLYNKCFCFRCISFCELRALRTEDFYSILRRFSVHTCMNTSRIFYACGYVNPNLQNGFWYFKPLRYPNIAEALEKISKTQYKTVLTSELNEVEEESGPTQEVDRSTQESDFSQLSDQTGEVVFFSIRCSLSCAGVEKQRE